jgi:hypothetical protein
MMTFRVIANTDYDGFCLQVQNSLKEGWTLRGEEMFVEEKYVQVFIKFPELMKNE